MKISFITVSWNTCGKTLACIESLRKHMPAHEVIVVDNNSSDDSCEQIKKRFPDVTLIENKDNRGFGPANNQGAAVATGDVYCFINNDTEVLDDGLARLAEKLMTDRSIGVIGPRIEFDDGRLQSSCGRFTEVLDCLFIFSFETFSPWKTPVHYWKRYNLREFKAARTVDWVSGCCLMVRRDLFEQVGRWDERYFAYYEDPALCRTVWKSGRSVVYDPSVTIIHHHGSGFSQRDWPFRIKNNLKSACLFLFDSDSNLRARAFKKLIRFCWHTVMLLTAPFKSHPRVHEKRGIIRELIAKVH